MESLDQMALSPTEPETDLAVEALEALVAQESLLLAIQSHFLVLQRLWLENIGGNW